MTPIGIDIRKQLETTFTALDRERITYWLMNFKPRGVDIDPGGGRSRISISGVAYEGQVADIFWGSIDPSLGDIISETFKNAQFDGNAYAQTVADRALDEVANDLRILVARTYSRMAHVDRALRGKGNPSSVAIKEIAGDIARWNDEITQLHNAIKDARAEDRPKGFLRFVHWMEDNKLLTFALAIFTFALSIAAAVIISLVVPGPPGPPVPLP
jgi:hypothetical protein